MFERHVERDLSAYCQGELSARRRQQVSDHLAGCTRCRAAHDEIKTGIELAGLLPLVEAPEELWHGIEAELDRGRARHVISSPTPPWRGWFDAPAARWATAVALVVVIGLLVARPLMAPRAAAWSVTTLAGSPNIGSGALRGSGHLPVGSTLSTDADSRAALQVADIGRLEVEPSTRLKLVATGKKQHRLSLEEGTIHAVVNAPPRLFLVDTPSATAVDLGCAYTLAVGPDGGSRLSVSTGRVALEDKGRQSLVPAGAACETRPGRGPGTPYFADAPTSLKEALTVFDFDADRGDALVTILDEARRRDSLTLWHLISRVDSGGPDGVIDRDRIVTALAELAPMPPGVTREGVLALDAGMLTRWREDLARFW